MVAKVKHKSAHSPPPVYPHQLSKRVDSTGSLGVFLDAKSRQLLGYATRKWLALVGGRCVDSQIWGSPQAEKVQKGGPSEFSIRTGGADRHLNKDKLKIITDD